MKIQIEIPATNNIENGINQSLQRKNRRRRLIGVELNKKDLILEFSDEPSRSAKQFAKPFRKTDRKSKKGVIIREGYKSVGEIMNRAFTEEQLKGLSDEGYELIEVIETNEFWILFWSKA